MKFNNTKRIMYQVLAFLLISGVNAQVIDLNEQVPEITKKQESSLVKEINKYEIVKGVARNYDSISLDIDNYTIVLDFENNKLKEIREYENDIVDLDLSFSKADIEYLFNNWQIISNFDKIKFLLRSDMPITDIIKFGAIAVTMR